MSNNLATYESADLGNGHDSMSVTAFVGGPLGAAVQITIAGKYAALSEIQVEHLIDLLRKRFSDNRYSATATDLDLIVATSGEESRP